MPHSPIGPSSAKRWVNCPGSIGLVAKAFRQKSSPYTKEGTEAHEVAEKLLVTGRASAVDTEMADGAGVYRDKILSDLLDATNPSRLYVESRVEIRIGGEKTFGTCDAWFYADTTLYTYDYKYGQGVGVLAEANEQLMMYAIGVLQSYTLPKIERIQLCIVQPRTDNVSTVNIPIEELRIFEQKAFDALQDKKTMAVGGWCRWCQAKAFCPETLKIIQETYGVNLNMTNALPTPSALSEEQILKYLENADLLAGWIRSIKNHALQFLENGGSLPGYSIESSLGNRKWRDIRVVEQKYGQQLGAKIYETKLLSPAQLEKLIKKELGQAALAEFNEFTVREKSDNKLVKLTQHISDSELFQDFSV